LVDDTIAFWQPDQGGQLFLRGVYFRVDGEPDMLEPDGYLFGDTQRPAKIQIALPYKIVSKPAG
jgi:hypothetical protein